MASLFTFALHFISSIRTVIWVRSSLLRFSTRGSVTPLLLLLLALVPSPSARSYFTFSLDFISFARTAIIWTHLFVQTSQH
jgi:hypothetical protein